MELSANPLFEHRQSLKHFIFWIGLSKVNRELAVKQARSYNPVKACKFQSLFFSFSRTTSVSLVTFLQAFDSDCQTYFDQHEELKKENAS